MYNSRLLFVISLIIFVGGICGREFATRGEAREALVADAMYRSGDWILPRSHSGAFASKPPLLHWIIGGFSSFTEGVTEFTARLPSALAASFFVFCFYLFLLKRFGKEESFISAIILMTSIEWFRAATGARVDLLFSAALCGTLLQMFAWFEEDLKGFKFNLILLLTVAALAKGPAAFVLSGAIFVLFAVAQKRSVFQIVMASMKCFLPALGLSAVWYLIAYQRGGAEFWNLVYEENFARFEGTMDGSPHKHGIGYLLVSIPIGLLPWTIAALPPLISWARSLKSTGNIAPSSFVKFSIISIITTTAFFCIPESKRSVYLLPVYPFFAFLIAQFLLKTRDSTFAWSKTALITFFFALLIAACTCLILVFLGIPDILPLNAEFRAEGQAYLKEIGSLVFGNGFVSQSLLALGFLALVASTISLIKARGRVRPLILTGLNFSLILFLAGFIFMPRLNNALSGKRFARAIKPLIQEDASLSAYRRDFYGLSFYLQHQIQFVRQGSKVQPGLLLLYEEDLQEIIDYHSALYVVPLARSEEDVEKAGKRVILLRLEPKSNP